MPWRTLAWILALSVAGWALTMAIISALARRPGNLGLRNGKLSACPGTPNCVCSQDDHEAHAIEPLSFRGDPALAWERLNGVMKSWPRTTIIAATETYLHAECRSLVFRFTDDVEFRLDPVARVIHIRSASRAGRSDLGVNRRRVEAIRKAFENEES